jgi:group I intron endonuclease
MYYTVYKVTNIINNKFYIGKHQTNNINDSYMGSGRAIKSAINVYGRANFIKEMLFIFNNEDDMNAKEKEIITEEFVNNPDTYNLGVGGEGGPHFRGKKHSTETKRKLSSYSHKKSADTITKLSKSMSIKKLNDGSNSGNRNPAFGTMWITNGQENKKIKKDVDIIPEGWYKGRSTLSRVSEEVSR